MKLTLNIDNALLARVMKMTGAKTKTEAIHAALAEIDRRHRLIGLLSEEIEMTPREWDRAIDEKAWETGAEMESLRVAETPATRDRKPRPRR